MLLGTQEEPEGQDPLPELAELPEHIDLLPVPPRLPPIEGLEDEEGPRTGQSSHAWLRTLIVALSIVLLVVLVVVLGVQGIHDGLRDRAVANRQTAQEHYELGLAHLEEGAYELAVAEFEFAARHHPSLPGLQSHLQEAKELARAQFSPTSETRQEAAAALYKQAETLYQTREWEQVVAVLDELRGIEAGYQSENVQDMLARSRFELGRVAVGEGRLEEAAAQFEAALALGGDPVIKQAAQEQVNLLNLYSVALRHWEHDWAATIQALKGLYALAPDYEDVKTRLHNAHIYYAQELAGQGNWCRASEEYDAAAQLFPLETTVDSRDEATFRCKTDAQPETPTPTAQPTVQPTTAAATQPEPQPTSAPSTPAPLALEGRIAFTSYDAVRLRYDVYSVDLAVGTASLLQENASHPAFSPDGEQLAFRNRNPSYLGLGVLNLSTNQVHELTDHVEDSTPCWSPDSSQIVFASSKESDRRWRIYVVSPQAVRAEGEEWTVGQMPAWSTDGSEIAYRGCDVHGNSCGVWVMTPGGFGMFLLSTGASDTSPAWSPDGSQVAYTTSRHGNWELYLVDTITGIETRLTENPATDVAPIWAPDGRAIAFLSDRGGAWAVYILSIRSGPGPGAPLAEATYVIATGDAYPDPANERLSWIP